MNKQSSRVNVHASSVVHVFIHIVLIENKIILYIREQIIVYREQIIVYCEQILCFMKNMMSVFRPHN